MTAAHAGLVRSSHLDDAGNCEQRLAIALSRELHDLLRQGLITGWARGDGGTPMEKIQPERWSTIILGFDSKALSQSPKNVCAWDRDARHGDQIAYVSVLFSRAELLHHLPLGWGARNVDTSKSKGTQALDTAKI